MCVDCGCNEVNTAVQPVAVSLHLHSHPHYSDHAHHDSHEHSHFHSPSLTRTLTVRERLLAKNDRFAQQNRDHFQAHGLFVLNILSSPGSGKTTFIEQMAKSRGDRAAHVGVIVGDLATENDALRLRAAGATARQITTGTACHLEADMVAHAASHLDLTQLDLLVIENVGNLVCPAAYDLGETLRVVLLSVTEGEDKPLKYPTAFQSADVVILTKIDLAEAVGFNRGMAIANIHHMAPKAALFEVSARTGAGMTDWLHYLQTQQDLQTQQARLPVEVTR